MTYFYEPLRQDHIDELVSRMVMPDRVECAAIQNQPYEDIDWSVLGQGEDTTAVYTEEGLVAVFGCTRHIPQQGNPWLLRTDSFATSSSREIHIKSVEALARWQSQYVYLWNYVSAANKVSVQWLSRLGFTIWESSPINGTLFHYFDWRA